MKNVAILATAWGLANNMGIRREIFDKFGHKILGTEIHGLISTQIDRAPGDKPTTPRNTQQPGVISNTSTGLVPSFKIASAPFNVNSQPTAKISTTVNQIKSKFGNPTIINGMIDGVNQNLQTVTCQWYIMFSDNTTAVITDRRKTSKTCTTKCQWTIAGSGTNYVTTMLKTVNQGTARSQKMASKNNQIYESEINSILKLSGLREAVSSNKTTPTESKIAVTSYDEDAPLANSPDEKTLSVKTQLSNSDDLHREKGQYAGYAKLGDNPRAAVKEAERKLRKSYTKFINESEKIVKLVLKNNIFTKPSKQSCSSTTTKSNKMSFWPATNYANLIFEETGGAKIIQKINNSDVQEALEVGAECFPQVTAEEFKQICREELDNDFSKSYVVKEGNTIIGGCFMGSHQLYNPDYPQTFKYKDLKGAQGVALFLLPKYRNSGVGTIFRNIIRQYRRLGYDYIWAEHLVSLNNLNQWTNYGATYVMTDNAANPSHYTAINLK